MCVFFQTLIYWMCSFDLRPRPGYMIVEGFWHNNGLISDTLRRVLNTKQLGGYALEDQHGTQKPLGCRGT